MVAKMPSVANEHIYDARFQTLEEVVEEHGEILKDHGGKLQQILIAVTRTEAVPQFNLQGTLSIARDIIAMLAIFGTLSVWVISTVTSSNDDVTRVKIISLEEDLNFMRDAFKWTPRFEDTTK